MKAPLAVAGAALACAAHAFSPLAMLARPPSGDMLPDFQRTRMETGNPEKVSAAVVTTGEGSPTGMTMCVWLKTVGLSAYQSGGYNSFMPTSFFCPLPSLATREGGPSLSNLLHHAYSEPLALDGAGEWSAEGVLPETYDTAGMAPDARWDNGCYCINVETDTELELVVGGVSRTVHPSDGKQIFNMNELTESRDVSVKAASPSAVVRLGVAENPFRRFYGESVTVMDGHGGVNKDPLKDFAGITDDEWQFVAWRGFMTPDSNVVHRTEAAAADVWYGRSWVTNRVDAAYLSEGRPAFAPFSRFCIYVFSLNGAAVADAGVGVGAYGLKAFGRVLSDGELRAVRDRDAERLRAAGAAFPRLAADWWRLDAKTVCSYEPATGEPSLFTEACGAVGAETTNGYVTTYMVDYTAVNGAMTRHPVNTEDLRLLTQSGTVSGNRITFPGPGTYKTVGVDLSGNVKTNVHTVSSSTPGMTARTSYTNDVEGTWQRMANDAVKTNCLAAALRGTYAYPADVKKDANFKLWNARRIPCQPHNSAWSTEDAMAGANNFSAQGHRGGVHPLSAHVVASAIHYGWTIGGALRFVSSDGTETGCVRTVGMEWMATNGPSWFSLAAWAATNGFQEAEIAAVRDVIVHRVAEGEVPPKCRPYFMKPSVAARHFGTAGVLGWGTTQNAVGLGIPVLFAQPSNTTWFSSWQSSERWPFSSDKTSSQYGFPLAQLVRCDVRAEALALRGDWDFVMPYGGDSGLPLYIELDGRFILVSHYKSTSSGPSYVSGHDVVKAYVESVGDKLLEIEE